MIKVLHRVLPAKRGCPALAPLHKGFLRQVTPGAHFLNVLLFLPLNVVGLRDYAVSGVHEVPAFLGLVKFRFIWVPDDRVSLLSFLALVRAFHWKYDRIVRYVAQDIFAVAIMLVRSSLLKHGNAMRRRFLARSIFYQLH